MSWARTSNFTLMPNKTVCSSAVGRRKRALPFCIPPRVRNLFRVVPQKVLTLQLVTSWGGGRTRPRTYTRGASMLSGVGRARGPPLPFPFYPPWQQQVTKIDHEAKPRNRAKYGQSGLDSPERVLWPK